MDTEYEKLVAERNKMKHIVDTGRKGAEYHRQATERYKQTVQKIKTLFREKHYNGS